MKRFKANGASLMSDFHRTSLEMALLRVLRVTVWHHKASNCDPRDRFVYQYHSLMIDSFSCTLLGAGA